MYTPFAQFFVDNILAVTKLEDLPTVIEGLLGNRLLITWHTHDVQTAFAMNGHKINAEDAFKILKECEDYIAHGISWDTLWDVGSELNLPSFERMTQEEIDEFDEMGELPQEA